MTSRIADHDIDRQFIDRMSPRSYTGEAIPDAALLSMLEAARWAPSCSNVQPWRFIYAKKDTAEWAPMFEAIMPMNQVWVAKAAALVVFVSDLHMMRGDQQIVSPWHGFDAGAAWMSFALQGHKLGWDAHAMGGFFPDKMRANLDVPADFAVLTVVSVGKRGPAEALPDELQARETPTPRRRLAESLFHGKFSEA